MDYLDITSINNDNENQNQGNQDIELVKNVKGFKIVNYNIGGIGENFDEIETLLNESDPKKKFHVLQICESWLSNNSRKQNISVEGYSYIRKDRPLNKKKKGGGLVVYYCDFLDIDFDDYINDWVSGDDLELMYYKVKSRDASDIFILSIYRPPTSKLTVLCLEL